MNLLINVLVLLILFKIEEKGIVCIKKIIIEIYKNEKKYKKFCSRMDFKMVQK